MKVRYCLAFLLCLFVSAPLALASNYSVEEIPEIIPKSDAARLKSAGVSTTFALLERGGDSKARKLLAQKAQIGVRTLESWIQLADLMRVRGIGPDVARLLTAAGTKTIEQLQTADSAALYDQIMKVNSSQHLSQNPPSAEHLTAWISQAKKLPIVFH